MSSRIHPGIIGAAVLSFALAAAFTAGLVTKSNEVKRYLEGDTEKASADTVPKLQEKRATKRKELEVLQHEVDIRQRELDHADLELHQHMVYYRDADLYGGIATPGKETDTVGFVKDAKLKEARLAVVRMSIEKSGERLEALKTEYASPARQAFPSLEKAIEQRQKELGVVTKYITDQDELFQKDRTALTEHLDKLKAEKDKHDKEIRTEKSARLTKIVQLEDRIRQLLELDLRWLSEIESVGTILQAEERSGRMIIDLGSSERAFPGLLFQVFSYEKGAFYDKGTIEVIDVKEGVSICRVLRERDSRFHPLTQGDRIGNPTFNPKRPKTFVVAGDFDHYNKSDLEAFIKSAGGIVADKLQPGVDFLVVRGDAKDRSGPERATAREYQVLGMKENQLLQYVRPLFPPKK
ncbi:MAG: BRCT domain-containing protein [Planctomycetota bacterium]